MRFVASPLCVLVLLMASAPVTEARAQAAHPRDALVSPNGTELRMIIAPDLSGNADVEIGEMIFQPGMDSGEHRHDVTEIFYVLSGELEHIVNGTSYVLQPGMAGWVTPPDAVRHRVPGATPVRALVIWAPAGEAERVASRWRRGPR